jgi:Tfp pilus assembly protein PilE
MSTKTFYKTNRGVGLVEVVIGCAIIATSFILLVQAYSVYAKASLANIDKVKAALLLEEGQEIVRGERDQAWSTNIANLTIGTNYYLNLSAGSWVINSTATSTDGKFYRTVAMSSVYRDVNQNIVGSGTLDSNMRKVTVTVSWKDTQKNATTSRSVATYLSNIYSN